ncbi:hypothetical protein [uncultured Microbacterium sp.]|uniref:hypothetical protein n=1 Tax=uncultured Microbacterium sp. TaxID=191216 RepID=UPI0025EBE559|nr:hypothetical protein [uncultured Microbacterium sp.]
MRAGAPSEVLAGAPLWSCRVSSWLGGQLLAATVPVASGRATGKTTDDAQHKLNFVVPRWAAPTDGEDVYDWRPGTDTRHPLARYGQELDVTIIVGSVVTAAVWETRVGRYVIADWEDDDEGNIVVTAEGVLCRPRDSGIGSPISPTGTLRQEARRIAPDGMGMSFDPELVDRACPPSMSWSDGRLDALQEIADAWPALLRTDEWGQIRFKAPLPTVPTPVLTFRDGEGGTLILAPRADSRRGAYNEVIASTSNTNIPDIVGVARIESGPMSVNGPYGVVSRKWSSPLISTQAAALASAQTMLSNSARPAQAVPARIAPDPRIELDDAVEIQRGSDAAVWGWVTAYDLPLTALDGDMRIDVGVPS